jgi:hypothetical protein
VNLEGGLHLGYRRLKSSTGRWVARFYLGRDVRWVYRGKESIKAYEKKVIGQADFSDADGLAILTYDQAQRHAPSKRADHSLRQASSSRALIRCDVASMTTWRSSRHAARTIEARIIERISSSSHRWAMSRSAT